MYYPYLRGRGFQETPAGVVIYKANVTVPVAAGQRLYKLEENSSIERNYIVGLWLTEPGANTGESTIQLDATRLNSAALILRVEETDVAKKIPLSHIKACNDQGTPYYVSLNGRINFSESTLVLNNNAGIAVGTVVEIQIDYPKLRRKAA